MGHSYRGYYCGLSIRLQEFESPMSRHIILWLTNWKSHRIRVGKKLQRLGGSNPSQRAQYMKPPSAAIFIILFYKKDDKI